MEASRRADFSDLAPRPQEDGQPARGETAARLRCAWCGLLSPGDARNRLEDELCGDCHDMVGDRDWRGLRNQTP